MNNSLHVVAVLLNPAFTTVSYTGRSVEADDKYRILFYWRITRGASLVPYLTLLWSGIVGL